MSERAAQNWAEKILAYVERKEQEVVDDRQEVEAWLH